MSSRLLGQNRRNNTLVLVKRRSNEESSLSTRRMHCVMKIIINNYEFLRIHTDAIPPHTVFRGQYIRGEHVGVFVIEQVVPLPIKLYID